MTSGTISIFSGIAIFLIITIGQWYYGLKIESLENKISLLESVNEVQKESIKNLEESAKINERILLLKDETIVQVQDDLDMARKGMQELARDEKVADWDSCPIPDSKLDKLRQYANGSADESHKASPARESHD